ncbi:endopolyphosphatase [Wolfiporia cocos MD-104 SS10]|uniref:Endopolyphosphatase n=1 Tax=Wolfiporia cocos (strain MD-104) TaxID=742152 RepID=A0A2H3JWV4_WOLCO|nr:endopolyphosphatase [Wolfiporia cocos MD-104 SS10]
MLKLKLLPLLFLLSSFAAEAFAAPAQAPMEMPAEPLRKLQGRFLHITDMHPDPHYRPDMSEKSACHRNKPKKASPRSGDYGMPYSQCDSPFTLTNLTMDFLEKEWSSEIDFVIWTGDSARHDNDRKKPRTTNEIYMLNRAMARRMEEVFTIKGIPVIPSIGNNDVWPHNIMLPGPNTVTSEFSSIWRSFVPFASYQVFQRGGYFSVEVVPGALAVISLNTMYFYHSNTAVGGCDAMDSQDPGNLQFDWLEVQLEVFRGRGMQVWISGHVPPSAVNFFPDCYARYTELSLRYQDTILGHLYGHMNADHFYFLDAEHLRDQRSQEKRAVFDNPRTEKRKGLYKSLLKDFEDMPKTSKNTSYDGYAVVNVSPSVVPNPYMPSFRIFTYNITGTPYAPSHLDGQAAISTCNANTERSTRCKDQKHWHTHPESPSRTNRLWTPLGYAQYYLPALDASSKKHPPKYRLEYLTYPLALLHPPDAAAEAQFAYPIPRRHLPKSLRNATRSESKYAPYRLEDLTIPSWTGLARRLAEGTEEKLRKRFRKYMYMGADEA